MEDGLREELREVNDWLANVLILVLMEDGLRDAVQVKRRRIWKQS